MTRLPSYWLLIALLMVLVGCAAQDITTGGKALPREAKWVQLPLINASRTPEAGDAVGALLSTAAHKRGLILDLYHAENQNLAVIDDQARYEKALTWAREHGYQYGLTGVIQEWQYTAGLNMQPAVGLTLQVVDVSNGQIAWSGSAASSRWSHGNLSGISQQIITRLLSQLPLDR